MRGDRGGVFFGGGRGGGADTKIVRSSYIGQGNFRTVGVARSRQEIGWWRVTAIGSEGSSKIEVERKKGKRKNEQARKKT